MNAASDNVSAIDPSTNAVIATAVRPTGPEAGDIYVTDSASDTVSVIGP